MDVNADLDRASVARDTGELLPPFMLPTVGGETIRRHDYRGRRHLALYFADAVDCAACRAALAALAERYSDCRAAGAEVLAIIPADNAGDGVEGRGPSGEGRRASSHPRSSALGPQPSPLAGAPYPVLCDAEGRVRERYGACTATGEPRAALFVADRHGEIVLRAVAAHRPVGGDGAPRGEGHGLPVDEILPLLELLQMRCAI